MNVENTIKVETGKQQVAATQSNCIVGHESKNQAQYLKQTQGSGKTLVDTKSLYFP